MTLYAQQYTVLCAEAVSLQQIRSTRNVMLFYFWQLHEAMQWDLIGSTGATKRVLEKFEDTQFSYRCFFIKVRFRMAWPLRPN